MVPLVALGLAVVYVCEVFYLRWDSNRVIAQRAAEAKRAEAKKVFDRMGSDRSEILEFFAHPPVISRGDLTMLCYSVSNAKSMTLEPQSSAVWPAFEKCVSVSPKKTITYTFTATYAAGKTKSTTAIVVVE